MIQRSAAIRHSHTRFATLVQLLPLIMLTPIEEEKLEGTTNALKYGFDN
jgi:hypothetical protein